VSDPIRLSAPWLRRLYDAIAPAYDRFATAVSSAARAAAMREVRRALAEREPAALGDRGASVLVAGCGTGLSLPALASMPTVGWIEAVDASPAMLHRARRRIREGTSAAGNTGKVGVRNVDLRTLPYPDDAFDLVLALYVLDVLPDDNRWAALRSIVQVVRPGGTLITATVAPPRRPVERLWGGAARAFPVLLGGGHPLDLRPMLRRTGLDIHRSSRHVQAGLPSHVVVSHKRDTSGSNDTRTD
jgi:ubiquinone/menaquinone biosynthesis C-methylase UbiE